MKLSHLKRWAAMIVAPMVALPMMALPAQATTANDDVVISEVYVKGDTKDGKYYDFVELYNPTNKRFLLQTTR